MNATMYTKSPCPFCDRAKMLFKHKGVTVTEVNAIENIEEMTQKVTEATGNAPKTVPQIWLEGQYIGGFQELVEYYKQNP